jgi:hypothetical protein
MKGKGEALGNAVPLPMARELARAVREALETDEAKEAA